MDVARWGFGAMTTLLVATAVLAAAGHDGSTRAVAGQPALALKRVGDFESPVHVARPPGERKLLFVVEQVGTVRVLRKGHVLPKPFLDLRPRVTYGGEAGLLSIAFHPRYEHNRRYFVYYVDQLGNIRVDGFERSARRPTRTKRGSRHKVIAIHHPKQNHWGGQLAFGPDRFLYLATGDGGAADDPDENAQDPNSLLGKLLRIEPRKKGGFQIPRDNPFVGRVGRDPIYALGLRNPWRFTFDRRSEELWLGDVGQRAWEEVDNETLASARGGNFGWDNLEGNHPFEAPFTAPANYRAPVHEYSSDPLTGNCAITGGHVVRGPKLPPLRGRYLYADFCAGDLRSLDAEAADPSITDASTGISVALPTSFGEGARGATYIASLEGPVYRLVAR